MNRLDELRKSFTLDFSTKEEEWASWGYMLRCVQKDVHMIIDRVERILCDRSDEEVEAAEEYLYSLFEQVHGHLVEKDGKEDVWSEDYLDSYYSRHPRLIDYIDAFEISELEGFENATWPDFFAVQALGALEYLALSWLYITSKIITDSQRLVYVLESGFTVTQAVEAITHAEMFDHNSRKIAEGIKEKVVRRSKKAGEMRHAKTDAVKKKFLEFYEGGDFVSNRDAARKFWLILPKEEKKLFSPENWLRTFTGWLAGRDHK